MEINYKYIIIEGNIGAGKTSLAQAYCKHYNATAVYEQFVDNPFLPRFYENPDKYALQLELSFLVDRFRQTETELNATLFHNLIVADYYLKKSLIFAAETLSEDDFKLYSRIFNSMTGNLPKPDLYIYLHQTPEQLLKNIAKRGRTYESNISANYLIKIQQSYFRFFKQVNSFPIVVVDCNQVNFLSNKEQLEHLLRIPERSYKKGMNILNQPE
ncbi:MAG: deoxynucleoside kinase [Salinivirgaceae bacterium]|jgi:deoxyguanosine kinase|nr:deoxynucleoside kinase [Salinivirgaceae bacterium]